MTAIADHLRSALDARITVHDGTPTDNIGPWIAVHGGSATPTHHRLAGVGMNRHHVWRLTCVSNTIAGARILAALVTDALDGAIVAGDLVTVRYVADPLEDRDDPSEWRWSVLIEATHYQE